MNWDTLLMLRTYKSLRNQNTLSISSLTWKPIKVNSINYHTKEYMRLSHLVMLFQECQVLVEKRKAVTERKWSHEEEHKLDCVNSTI